MGMQGNQGVPRQGTPSIGNLVGGIVAAGAMAGMARRGRGQWNASQERMMNATFEADKAARAENHANAMESKKADQDHEMGVLNNVLAHHHVLEQAKFGDKELKFRTPVAPAAPVVTTTTSSNSPVSNGNVHINFPIKFPSNTSGADNVPAGAGPEPSGAEPAAEPDKAAADADRAKKDKRNAAARARRQAAKDAKKQ